MAVICPEATKAPRTGADDVVGIQIEEVAVARRQRGATKSMRRWQKAHRAKCRRCRRALAANGAPCRVRGARAARAQARAPAA